MFDYEKVHDEVISYLDDYIEDFDVDGIMDELGDKGVASIDDLDHDVFVALLKRYDH